MNKMSLKKCHRQQRENQGKGTDGKAMKIENEMEDSSKKSGCEVRLSGHSTPIRKKGYDQYVEDSPEVDYRCSPIFLPCTQEGGNEVAWDWQSSKTSKETNDEQMFTQTPKRHKLFQKKRNSNSPLLQKPLKRKQMRMENIEDIGKMAAELKALTEKMCIIKQNDERCATTDTKEKMLTINKLDEDTQLLIELEDCNADNILPQIHISEERQYIESVITDSGSKRDSSYEDLFDDSVNECMVKCSQEVEQKYLGKISINDGTKLPLTSEDERLSTTSERTTPCSTLSNHSTNTSGNLNVSKSALLMNVSGCLKTYSRNTVRTSSTFDSHVPNSKEQNVHKIYCNNNIISKDSKQILLDDSKSDLFEILDDSFDDCLATCLEDDKLKSGNKSAEYDNIFPEAQNSTHLGNKKYNNSVGKNIEATAATSPSGDVIENRKFFKTKNLMDQYIRQGKCPNGKVSRTIISRHSSANSVLQSPNRSSVSTGFPGVGNCKLFADKDTSPHNSAENEYAHVLNRSTGTKGGTRIVKYKSTSSLCSSKKEVVQCTPAEIERKRLEAKMKLEAKRKLQQSLKMDTARLELSVKGYVKR